MKKLFWGFVLVVVVWMSVNAMIEQTPAPLALTPKLLAEKAKEDSAAKTGDAHDAVARIGAVNLAAAMKDPESFTLISLVVMPNGAACYEYRAPNSFGAFSHGLAVLTRKGHMYVEEQNDDAFRAAWNKECTGKRGTEIAPGAV